MKDRDIDAEKIEFPEKNSPEYCVEWCYRRWFMYAGLQYAQECWCGDTYGKHGAVDSGECNMACPGSTESTCGGYLVQSVYKTGRTTSNPMKLRVSSNASPPVRLAFILLLNGRSDRQVKRLLSLLYRPQHFYLLHVDARQDFLRRELERLLEERPLLKRNVRLADYGMTPTWTGASLLTVILRCIQELLEWSNEWDFVLNLSETDLPVKSVDDLSEYLAEYKGLNFLVSVQKDVNGPINAGVMYRTFVECEYRMWMLAPRTLPDGIRFDAGSDWMIIDRRFANYSVYAKDDLVVGMKRVYEYTYCPAETFFNTLLHHSEFCSASVNAHLRLINWIPDRGCKCNNKITDWCGCSPNDFCATDADRLRALANEPVFFARKFEAVVCNGVIEQVVKSVLNTRGATGETQDGGYYWHNEYDWLDRRPPDDATMAMYQSWTRLAPKWLEALAQCMPRKANLRQVEQVRYMDAFKGIVTAFELDATDAHGSDTRGSRGVQMMWTTRPFKRIVSAKASVLLRTLDVGSKFDPKEDILRDVAAAFGPNSSLTAVVHMRPISAISDLTFVWLDPEGSLAHLKEDHLSTLNEEMTVNAELTLHDPLMAGSWTLQLYLNKELIGERVFIVLPIEPLATSPPRYSVAVLAWLTPLLKTPRHDDVPSNVAAWTDKLVGTLWSVEDICAFGHKPVECLVNPCINTQWSAISSDPHRWFDRMLAENTKN